MSWLPELYCLCLQFTWPQVGGRWVKLKKSSFYTHQVLPCLAVTWMCIFLTRREKILSSSPSHTGGSPSSLFASVPPASSTHISDTLFEVLSVARGCVSEGEVSFPSETYTPSDPDEGRMLCSRLAARDFSMCILLCWSWLWWQATH